MINPFRPGTILLTLSLYACLYISFASQKHMAISIRLCSGRTGFEVTTSTRIDMVKASGMLATKVATKHLLMLNYNGVEVSIYPSGRMIVRTGSKEESLEIARRILAELGLLESDERYDH